MTSPADKPRPPAPVHLWDPPFCGDMDLLIRRDGTWIHEGRPIRRLAMRQLFASILKREGDEYFLVNPVEKVRIQVEDCPFQVVAMEQKGRGRRQEITFITDMAERITLDEEHPLSLAQTRVQTTAQTPASEEPHPVVEVRDGLHGLISRSVFYELVELAEPRPSAGGEQDQQVLGIHSRGCFFELGRI